MPITAINQMSATRASNSDIDGINIAEGCPAGNLNDAVRELMVQLAEANAGTAPVADTWSFGDPIDLTKRVRLDAGGVTAGQTRVLTAPDENITLGSITPWVAYTPTLVGFGTPSGVTFRSRRVGGSLEIFARFSAGTSTATEARIPIGFNGTEANVTISSLMNSAVWTVGLGGLNIAAASQYFLTAVGGATYLRIGLQSGSRTALTAVDGNVALPSSGNTLAFTASVPIEGWL